MCAYRRPTILALLTGISTALLLTTLAFASDPPWKGKPYPQWDDKDIQRVFTDSPWARTTTITRTWLPITAKDLPNEALGGHDRGIPGTVDRSAETTVGGELEVHVFWASSRVMRAASARKAILQGAKKDLDVDKYVTEPQDDFQIVVQSEDLAPFLRHDEQFFMDKTFLDLKKSKQKIAPSHIRYERDDKGLITSATFLFPRKSVSGVPILSPDEKNVDFVCKIENSLLRVTFEPPKMVDQNGPAL